MSPEVETECKHEVMSVVWKPGEVKSTASGGKERESIPDAKQCDQCSETFSLTDEEKKALTKSSHKSREEQKAHLAELRDRRNRI